MLHEPLDQHQPLERLAEADAVAEECAGILARDVHEIVVAILLVLREASVDLRVLPFPFRDGLLARLEELVHGAQIDVVGRILPALRLNRLQDGLGDVRRLVPPRLEPLLKLVDIVLELDVELDVLRETSRREVAGSDERIAARHVHRRRKLGAVVVAERRDVGLGVELAALIHLALDLAGLQRLENAGNADEEIVLLLRGVETLLHLVDEKVGRLLKDGTRPLRHLVAEDDPHLVQLLPLSVQRQKPADLQIARCDVQLLGNGAPLRQVPLDAPRLVGIVDDVQVRFRHDPFSRPLEPCRPSPADKRKWRALSIHV